MRPGNHDGSSTTMEHAIVNMLLEDMEGELADRGLQLVVCVDGDLNTNGARVYVNNCYIYN